MLVLACLCALITAAMITVVGLWHRRDRPVEALTQARSLYATFVADVDRRAQSGEIDADLANEERVEAARALLQAQSAPTATAVLKPAMAVLPVLLIAGLSFGLYLFIGHPWLADQPYAKRLPQWAQAAQANPDSVPPEALAAVLRHKAGDADKGNNPVFWLLLGRVDMMAGHYYDAAKDFERAQMLAPQAFTAWSELGEALTFVAKGTSGGDAQKAFQKALETDPKDARAHYYLGKMKLDAGRYDEARADFLITRNQLAIDDSRQTAIAEALQDVDNAQKAQAASRARIEGMVSNLAAQLGADPENADGWARLLRSYDVLGDTSARGRALKAMQAHYRDRPAVAASIVAKATAAVGAENTGGQ